MRHTMMSSVAVFAAAAMTLTGCSGGDSEHAPPANGHHPDAKGAGPPGAGAMVTQAYQKIEAESFAFRTTMKLDEREVSSTGVFDTEGQTGQMRVTMPHEVKLKVRVLADSMYMAGFMGDEGWLEFDLNRFPVGNLFSGAANPVANASYLLAASDDVKKVADGRYEGSLDLQEYLKEHADKEEAERLSEALGDLSPEEMKAPFEAAIDKAGRLTELTTTMTLNILAEKMTITHTAKFFDFGVAVDVKKPPADGTEKAPDDLYLN